MPDTLSPSAPPLRATISAQIYALLQEKLPQYSAQLTDEMNFTDAGIASLEVMLFIFEIEEAFDIALVEPGLDDFDTLGQLIAIVTELVTRKAARE